MPRVVAFLIIAGTYTPFTLISLRGAWGWSIFGVVWGLALIGIIFKMFFIGRFEVLSTIAYVGMGWICVIAYRQMIDSLTKLRGPGVVPDPILAEAQANLGKTNANQKLALQIARFFQERRIA